MRVLSVALAFAAIAMAMANPIEAVAKNVEGPAAVSALRGRRMTAASCGGSGDLATNVKVTMSPATPKPGDSYTLTLEFDLPSEVTDGSVKYAASLNGLPVYSDSANLCTDLSNSGNSCPLKAGHNVISSSGKMFDVSGKVKSTANWFNSAGASILCWGFVANL